MYAKLFSRITESSIIEESITTRWVFVALLAISDLDGTVIGTDIAIARRINVPLKDFEESMKVLMSPDKDSNNKEFEGRRILPSEGERGYFLTGYATYRSLKTEDERRNYMKEYMAKRRENVNSVNSVNISLAQLTHTDTHTSTNENTEPINTKSIEGFDEFWKSYPRKVGKEASKKAWRKLKPSKDQISLMVAAVEEQKKSEQWMKDGGQFIPYPQKWLNEGRWDDEQIKVVDKSNDYSGWLK